LGEDIDLTLGGELYGFASGARSLKHWYAGRLGVIDEGTEVVWARGQLVASGRAREQQLLGAVNK
jgi:hypothetical protein